jgi:hypothetical protein
MPGRKSIEPVQEPIIGRDDYRSRQIGAPEDGGILCPDLDRLRMVPPRSKHIADQTRWLILVHEEMDPGTLHVAA